MRLPKITVTKEESLSFHSGSKKGKLGVAPIKPLESIKDLSLAYSPGVGYPCLEIQKDSDLAYEYTSKGNLVAVITNGTAVLGYGNIGSKASKPVMEGKSVLMKRFAGVDSIDVLVDRTDPDKFIEVVSAIADTWGGINLEDIKAPDCFYIESELRKKSNIPVFHDDQHGTATVALAGLINATEIAKKDIRKVKIVMNGAGASSIATAELLLAFGIPKENIIMCDTKGVIFEGRAEGMNPYKEKWASKTKHRTLTEAVVDADVLIGLSVKGAFTGDILKSMSANPIVFALSNPDPEITPEEAEKVRSDVIIATGRSDYTNQINNVMCFPYIFRAALDTRVKSITKEMQIAAAKAISGVAKDNLTEEVREIMGVDSSFKFGKDYILPNPFDRRLFLSVSIAIAKEVLKNKDIKCPFKDADDYKEHLISNFFGIVTK